MSPALAGGFLTTMPPGKPKNDSAIFNMRSPRLPSSGHLDGKGESPWRIHMGSFYGPDLEGERKKSGGSLRPATAAGGTV